MTQILQNNSRGLVSSAVLASVMFSGGAGQSAFGSTVTFLNPAGPGHFSWNETAGHDVLDILVSAADQPGTVGGHGAFRFYFHADYGSYVRSDDPLADPSRLVCQNIGGYSFLVGMSAGTLIGTGAEFLATSGAVFNYYPSAPTTTLLPEGASVYLGVRFPQADGHHFGWIGVVRTGNFLDTFAWGYETEAGVPIAAGAGIPAPGGLALLALAALTQKRRRRSAK